MMRKVTSADVPGMFWQSGIGQSNADFVNKLLAFIDSDFKETKFTKNLYTMLTFRFMHIAHYNQYGFYDTWFSSPERQLEWLRHVTRNHYRNRPEEAYIARIIRENGLIERLENDVANEIEAQERAAYARLQAKYGDR